MGQWAWPRIAAVYMIVVTPGIVAFAFAQRLFLKGLMEGVLKASKSRPRARAARTTSLARGAASLYPERLAIDGAVREPDDELVSTWVGCSARGAILLGHAQEEEAIGSAQGRLRTGSPPRSGQDPLRRPLV